MAKTKSQPTDTGWTGTTLWRSIIQAGRLNLVNKKKRRRDCLDREFEHDIAERLLGRRLKDEETLTSNLTMISASVLAAALLPALESFAVMMSEIFALLNEAEASALRMERKGFGIVEFDTHNFRDWEERYASVLAAPPLLETSIDGVVVPLRSNEQETIAGIVSLFRLPVWERRHELYSVWTGAQILSALSCHKRWLHNKDGRLGFAFDGAHVATIECGHSLFVYYPDFPSSFVRRNEGRARRATIQPDHRILQSPIHDAAESTTLCVDCKHRANSDAAKVAGAANDYASACANSHVILVSCGSLDPAIYEKIKPELADRILIIERFRPGNAETIKAFSAAVVAAFQTRPLEPS